MKKVETTKLLAILKAYFPRIYSTKDMDAMFLIELWTQEFGMYDYGIVRRAICDLCNEIQFAPSISEIRAKIQKYEKQLNDAKETILKLNEQIKSEKCRNCHPQDYLEVIEKCGSRVCVRSQGFKEMYLERKRSYLAIQNKLNPESLIEITERPLIEE